MGLWSMQIYACVNELLKAERGFEREALSEEEKSTFFSIIFHLFDCQIEIISQMSGYPTNVVYPCRIDDLHRDYSS